MSKNNPEKSPYKNHSIKEVQEVEEGRFYIQVGEGMFESESGKMAFQKDRAELFFQQTMDALNEMKQDGSPEEVEDAIECLLNFRIIPLRFH